MGIVARMAAALAIAVTGALAAASPAQAHPDVYGPSCWSEYATIECTLSISGAAAPVAIRWYFKGVYRGQCDDRTYCAKSCVVNTWVSVETVVTDASGVPVVNSPSYWCYWDPR